MPRKPKYTEKITTLTFCKQLKSSVIPQFSANCCRKFYASWLLSLYFWWRSPIIRHKSLHWRVGPFEVSRASNEKKFDKKWSAVYFWTRRLRMVSLLSIKSHIWPRSNIKQFVKVFKNCSINPDWLLVSSNRWPLISHNWCLTIESP